MTEFEETSKKIQDLVDEVFKQGIGVGYDHGLEVGTQNGYRRGYENGKKSEQTDDLISRQALLDAIDNERKSLLDMGMKGAEHIVVHHARRIIEELPPVNPQEPKTGHWIALENRFELGDRVKCSECGQVFVVGDNVSRHYCPNCGAKMEGEQDADSD